MVNAAQRGRSGALSALRHRDFALFWSAALISNAANWMQQFTVPFLMYDMTGSNTWVGAAAFTLLIPAVGLAPVAGMLADRFSRQNVMALTLAVTTAGCAAMAVLQMTGGLTPWRIVGLNLVIGTAVGIQASSWLALVPLLVPDSSLLSAIRLNSAQFTATRAIGPLTGAGLLALVGAGAVFMANAATYALLMVAILTMRPRRVPPPPRQRVRDFLVAGFKYVRRRSSLRQAVLTGFVMAYLGGALVHLAAGLASEDYGVGETGLAGLITAAGVGSVIGSALVIRYADHFERSLLTRWGLGLYATAALLAVATTSYPVGLAGYFLSGVAHVCVAISVNSAIQSQVAEEMRGRAMSLYLMGLFGGWPLGALIGGWLGDHLGLRLVFGINGLALFGFLVATVVRWSGLRALDTNQDVADRERRDQLGAPGSTA
ncbi:MAG: MFS transporter [bacterium]|nr:MFS transporter [bacterium]